jgi:hypothetical protein
MVMERRVKNESLRIDKDEFYCNVYYGMHLEPGCLPTHYHFTLGRGSVDVINSAYKGFSFTVPINATKDEIMRYSIRTVKEWEANIIEGVLKKIKRIEAKCV